jgi:serine/threonine protein kinase
LKKCGAGAFGEIYKGNCLKLSPNLLIALDM